MTNRLSRIFPAIRAIVKQEGLKSLMARGWEFILHRTFFSENYYVVRGDPATPYDQEGYLPKLENYHGCIISANQEADELISQGFSFGAYELNVRATLDRDVRTCCIFINKEFAHMSSKTDNKRGKDVVDSRPFHIDFSQKNIISGKALTVPKFRRLGLRKYSLHLMNDEDQGKGYENVYATISTDNMPTLMNAARNPKTRIISKCWYIRILCFRCCREKSIDPITVKELLEQKPESS